MKYLLVILTLAVFWACNENIPPNDTPSTETNVVTEPDRNDSIITTQSKNVAPPNRKNLDQDNGVFQKTIQAGKVKFNVSCQNRETSTIHVNSEGLEVRKYERDFTVEGQLKNAFSLDLDGDGFSEIYLVVQGTDDSGNLDLMGIASFKDKSAGEIYVKDVTVPRQMNTDKIYVKGEKLIREFNDEKGELQVYQYNLKKGEAGFILEPNPVK